MRLNTLGIIVIVAGLMVCFFLGHSCGYQEGIRDAGKRNTQLAEEHWQKWQEYQARLCNGD